MSATRDSSAYSNDTIARATRSARTEASLPAGTTIAATTSAEISSRTNHVGETVAAAVTSNVRDAAGRVVIPAGSTIHLRITGIAVSENRSDSTGTLTLAVESVEIDGERRPVEADIEVSSHLEGRSTSAGDVAKVGAGAAAGAVVGRVLGGKKGTIIGGVLGGAVGAQRAVETKDRDVVVPAGTPVDVRLRERFIASVAP